MHPYAWPTESDAFALVPALSLAYYLVVRRHPVARWRIACFALAMLLLVAVFATPLETLALNYLLTAHFLQNVTVAEWAPALLVLSLPPQLARRVHVPMIPALLVWLGTYFAWHVAGRVRLRAPSSALGPAPRARHVPRRRHGALVAGHPRPCRARAPRPRTSSARSCWRARSACCSRSLPDPVYSFYEARPTVWGLSHILDQEIAGTTMAAEQAVVFFAAFAFYFTRFLREEEAASQPPSSNARTPSTPARQSSSTSSSGRT